MDKIDTSKLENLLFQSIKKLHQQTLIIRHERLNLLASNLATSIIKKEANLDSKENRGGLIPDALRYEEINFVIPLKEPINDISINNNLVSYIKEKYIDIISSDINSIGTAIRVLPSNEILTVIIAAYLKQNVAPIPMESVQQKTRPGKKTPPGGAWKNFSDSQNARQGPPKNNYNKNHGAGNFKKSQHSPRQQQPRQQPPPDAASNNSKNIPWGIASQALTQEQQQQRKNQQQTSNTYSTWKPQEPQKNDQVQSQQPSENSQQNVENEQAQQLHSIQRNTIWHSFQPTEAFDDKNAYRKVPADMKRSHIRNNEQQKPQGRKPQNQKQRQQRNQQQQPQNQQPEKEVNQDQQEAQTPQTAIDEIPVPSEVTENVPQQQTETEDNHSKWSEIRNILSYDDKNEFHKLPQEFRSSHSTTHTNKKETEKQRSPRRDKPQPKVSGNQQQKQKQQQQQQQQQQPQQPLNEPEKEVIGVPPRTSIWSAAVNEQTPYDDSHDVRKVPVQLRRSHHELELEDKKKKQNQKNQERKELKRQARNQKQANRNEKAQEQQQQQQKQVVEEPLKSRAASAWANLNIAPPPPQQQQQQQLKSQRPQRMQTTQQAEEKVSSQTEPSQETVQQQQDENIVQKPPENEQPQAQEVVEQQQEPVQEKPLSAPKQSIWSSITIGMSDPKKPKQATKPPQQQQQPQQQEVQQQQPNQPETSPSEPHQEQAENIAFRSANLENNTEAEQQEVEKHEEEEEEVAVEYKSLAPPAHIVNVWAGVQSIKKYDDSNDWRKTPTEFRRSHAPANVEQNKVKKSPRNPKKKNNEPQIQRQQRQQKEPEQQQQQQQNEPEQQQQQVDVQVQQIEQEKEQVQLPEEQNQEEHRPEAEKKPSWVNLEETPYDDKYDMRKIPPELRRTHNTQPIDKSKKDKRNKKDKDWSNDKKKGKDGDNRRNPLIQRPNPAQQPEPQSQPPEEEHLEVENEQEQQQPVDPKKSIWSMAVPDTPYDDKYHLSKVPPQLRRTHKLNEEKARDEANKANREKESRSNRKRNNRNNQQNQNKNQDQDQNKNDEKQEEKAPLKNLSPWASFNIEPDQTKKVSNVQPQKEEEQEQQQPEAQQENEQQNQIEETDDVDNRTPEPEPQPEPELEPAVIDEPVPRPLKKEVHSAWLSVNLQSKP